MKMSGTVLVEIERATIKHSKVESGYGPRLPYFHFELKVLGPHTSLGRDVLYASVSTSPSAQWKREEFARALKLPLKRYRLDTTFTLGKLAVLARATEGKQLKVTVADEKFVNTMVKRVISFHLPTYRGVPVPDLFDLLPVGRLLKSLGFKERQRRLAYNAITKQF